MAENKLASSLSSYDFKEVESEDGIPEATPSSAENETTVIRRPLSDKTKTQHVEEQGQSKHDIIVEDLIETSQANEADNQKKE